VKPSRGQTFLIALILSAVAIAVATAVIVHGLTARRYHEPELPEAWAHRENPLRSDPESASRGRAIYMLKGCVLCHGAHADGKGSAAKGMTPPPSDFANGDVLKTHSDAWLFWRISEGKRGTGMPSWSGALTEQERWDLVNYLRRFEKR